MAAAHGHGPLFDTGPRDLTQPPSMDSVVNALVSRTREFGFVYVAPSIRPSLPKSIRCHPPDDLWQHLDPFRRSRKSVKSVAPRTPDDNVMLEWGMTQPVGHRVRAENEFAWWLYGSMPMRPMVLRAWAPDLARMLWLLAWPGSATFAGSALGLAIADDYHELGDSEALLVEADRLQSAGDSLGLALSWWWHGIGNRLAVALEVYEQASRLRSEWSSRAGNAAPVHVVESAP
jgi:hypothetical protein